MSNIILVHSILLNNFNNSKYLVLAYYVIYFVEIQRNV